MMSTPCLFVDYITSPRCAGQSPAEQKGRKMTRAEQDAYECWDEENKEFDWEEYQKFCDIADYWDCEE